MTNALRRAAELMSRGLVVKRWLPADFGRQPVWVSPESALKYWRLDMEAVVPELFAFARAHVRPGAVVWDIGANLGLFSLAAAMKAGSAGRVVAVEPDPQMLKVLRRSVGALPTHAAPVQAVCAAVSDAEGLVQLSVSRRGRSSNFMAGTRGSSTSGGVRDYLDVVAVTLDGLMATTGAPDVVKVDVETAELLVLQGAERVLAEARPVWLIEVEAAHSQAATEVFKAHRYRLYDWDRRDGVEVARAPFNTLAVPEERAG